MTKLAAYLFYFLIYTHHHIYFTSYLIWCTVPSIRIKAQISWSVIPAKPEQGPNPLIIVFFFVNNPLNTVLLAQLHKNLVQIVSHEALRPQIKKILDDLTCWWPCVCVAAGVQAQPPPPVAMTSRRSCSRETGSRRETTSPILRQPPATSPSPVLPPDAQTQYSNINLLIKNKNYWVSELDLEY